jgi:LacI family transcriptional regulator
MHIMPETETGREAAETLFSRHPAIDAILAFNDLVAIGALQACQAAGKKVPEEVAIIGADDIPLSSLIHPRLTSSHVDLAQIGRLAMQTLLEMFAGESPQAAYLIEPELVLRESG